MQYHQPQLSLNSVQSMVEPVTPPSLGQMNKKSHQKTQSLDLSNFNQFMAASLPSAVLSSSNSPMLMMNAFSPNINNGDIMANNSFNFQNGPSSTTSTTPNINGLPSISEFELPFDYNNFNFAPGNINSALNTPLTSVTSGSEKNLGSNGKLSRTSASSNSDEGSSTPSTAIADMSSKRLEDLNYLSLSKDQLGCRFLQKKLDSPTESDIVRDLLYIQIKFHFLSLILDPFGNYLIQKLCDHLTSEQKTAMIQSIYPNVFQISINQYGTRSLQKIIECIDDDVQTEMIVLGFSQKHTSINQIVTLINDLNGNHVIQKCIFKFLPSKLEFIVDAIVYENNIITVSTHKHGCCVLQKLLSMCTLQQTFQISVKVVQYLLKLINDQFGNYIIQFLLDSDELNYFFLPKVYSKLSNELCHMSSMKFSSNVVEKFILKLYNVLNIASKHNNSIPHQEEVVPVVMKILLSVIDSFTSNLNRLIKDNYGNYTLQTLTNVKYYSQLLNLPRNHQNQRFFLFQQFSQTFTSRIALLMTLTRDLLPSIKSTSYAKKIKLKVKAYSEFIENQALEPVPTKKEPNFYKSNNGKLVENNKHKQHTRHSSLPNATFDKKRNQHHQKFSSVSGKEHFMPDSGQLEKQPFATTSSRSNLINCESENYHYNNNSGGYFNFSSNYSTKSQGGYTPKNSNYQTEFTNRMTVDATNALGLENINGLYKSIQF